MLHNQFSRTGTVLSTEKAVASRELATYTMEKIKELHPGFHVDFDCLHNNGQGYAVHEFLGALGGVSVRYMEESLARHLLREAIDSQPSEFVKYTTLLKNLAQIDKYMLRETRLNHDKVVFLSGSNIMRDNIDFEVVSKAVADGAIIKPHPVTHAKDIEWLKSTYGADKVLGPKVSGGQLLQRAEVVYVPKNSEMWLNAIALQKTVRSISNGKFPAELYRIVIDSVIDHPVYFPRVALNRLLSNPHSGIFFSQRDVDRGLPVYIRRVRELLQC